MARSRGGSYAALLVPALAPVLLLVVLRTTESIDFAFQDSYFHLIAVTLIASCALTVAVAAGRAGWRSAHHGPVWLACGCLTVGIAMVAHGLLTPGVMDRPFSVWISRMPDLAIFGFAVGLGLASLPRRIWTSRLAVNHRLAVLIVPNLVVLALAVAVVVDPLRWHGGAPVLHEELLTWVVSAVDLVLFGAVAFVHWRRWRLGRDVVQYALVLAPTMAGAAILSFRFGELWRLSWWDYHGFLLAGFGGAVYAVWVRAGRAEYALAAIAATFDDDPMTHIVQGYPDALKTLVRAVEEKDSYTHGHSARTAEVAVELGLRLGLDGDDLRALARGAYLHDVGKIAIPDEILNKPGRLTPEERDVIKTHARVGYELVQSAPALGEALPVVLHHHERWDGTGYPDGLAERRIPLVARVVAVADVWDALTSDRSYRPGMSPRAALSHIVAGRESHFDPNVVDAMVRLAADWGYTPHAVDSVDDDLLMTVTEQCHEVGANRS